MSEDWQRVGRAIEARIAELMLTKAEVYERSGAPGSPTRVSDKTLSGYIAGAPISRTDKRRGICKALGWTSDSIDRILAGDEPVETVDLSNPEVLAEVRELRATVEELRDLLLKALGIETGET